MRVAAMALALGLAAGCAPPAPPPQGLRLASDGLRPNGTDLRIDFGRAEAGVIAAVTRVLGATPTARQGTGCKAVTWPDGLTLIFDAGRFLGWADPQGVFERVAGAPDARAAGVACPDPGDGG